MTRHAGITSQETKENILAAAAEEFAEKGYDDASLRCICGKAHVTTGALYFFFDNKEDLFRNVTEPAFEEIQNLSIDILTKFLEYDEESWDEDELSNLMADRVIALLSGEGAAALSLLRDLSHPTIIDRSRQAARRIAELTYQYMDQFHKIDHELLPAEDPAFYWVAQIQIDSFAHLIQFADDEEMLRRQARLAIRFVCGGLGALAKPGHSK